MSAADICLWKRLRSPFWIPSGIHCCQMGDWENIECDVAGCVVCGKIHVCEDATHCPLVTYEGRHVCQITGFVSPRPVFDETEFMDTVAGLGEAYLPAPKCIETEQIESWVDQVLSSAAAKNSLKAEMVKRRSRIKQLFIRAAKTYKQARMPINIVSIISDVMNQVSESRVPVILSHAHASELRSLCVRKIERFCKCFMEFLECKLPVVKMKGFVVGVLYLMRKGIVIHTNIVILDKIPILQSVLPIENQLNSLFDVSIKVITEVENVIKLSIKKAGRDRLIEMGFDVI